MLSSEEILRSTLKRLEPAKDFNVSLARLLYERAGRNLRKYRIMNQNFQKKYAMTFEEFRNSDIAKRTDFETEQDYCDWEMAITGIEEVEEEIKKLKSFLKK